MTALRLLPEFEAALCKVPGISQASVRTTADALPIEVHVVARDEKPAKQVVRDVQSVAMAQFDLDIDHRIVSVVQIPDGAVDVGDDGAAQAAVAQAAEAAEVPRPALTSISTTKSEGETLVDVTMAIGREVYTGRATGPSGPVHRPRIIATATLAALTELLGIPASVESAQVLEVGMREVAVTTLTLTIPAGGHTWVLFTAE